MPFFKPIKTKHDYVSSPWGNFRMRTNPPSKEIMVKTRLSERISLKLFTMWIRIETRRVDKIA